MLNRRVAILSAVIVAALPMSHVAASASESVDEQHRQWRETEPLRPPAEIRASHGVLEAHLKVAYAANQIAGAPQSFDGRPLTRSVWLRSYNGGLVGPTLRIRPGDLMSLRLQNQLPSTEDSREMTGMSHHVQMPGVGHGTYAAEGGGEPGWNLPHAFNVTNLHTHGLWVSPAGNSDNVLISVYPGQSFLYQIYVARDHPPGTHFYHPHRHGSVAMQMSSGMSGMIIIEGGLDDVQQIREAQEQIMVFQQIAYDPDDCKPDGRDVRPPEHLGAGCIETYKNMKPEHWPYLDSSNNGKPRFTTVNGQVQPTVYMQPGEVQRWRILHAGIRESIELALVRDADGRLPDEITGDDLIPFHLIAEDGIAYGFIEDFIHFGMESGNRADVLVQLHEAGRYFLVDLPEGPDTSLHLQEEALKTLAFILVDGPERPMPLPSNEDLEGLAPYPHVEDWEVKNGRCQKMQFDLVTDQRMKDPTPPEYPYYLEDYMRNTRVCRQANTDGYENACFFVNGKAFDDRREPRKVMLRQAPLGASREEAPGATADEWQLSSLALNHPYHIHVNPFEVLNPPQHAGHTHPDGRSSVWRDTLMVRASDTGDKGEYIQARTRYRRYVGAYVLHCHILDHEDKGMMEEVEVMPLPPEQQYRYFCDP